MANSNANGSMTVKAILNGQEVELTYNSTSDGSETYVGTITAPNFSSFNLTDHKAGIKLIATDKAGNSTTVTKDTAESGSETVGYANLGVRVKETKAPTINITTPGEGAYLTSSNVAMKFTLSDNTIGDVSYDGTTMSGDSGVDISSVRAKVSAADGKSKDLIAEEEADGVYGLYGDGDYPTLSDGSYTLEITASDNDGNSTTVQRKFTVDVAAPSLNVTSPSTNSTISTKTVTLTGTTSDATSGLASLTAKVTGPNDGETTTTEISVSSDGSFSQEITLYEGTNIIDVTATDKAGVTYTQKLIVTVDTSAPVFKSIAIDKSEVSAGGTITITVKVM